MATEFPSKSIEALSIGAWILGTGGGGSPYLAQLNLKRLYQQGKRCSVIQPEDLGDDDLVAVVSQMGAPLVGQERLVDPAYLARAVRLMEEFIGKRFSSIMAVEIGGGNALSPFLASALLDIPVVDADSMGRAYPEAQNTSFAIGNLKMYPLSLIDCRDNEAIVSRVPSWVWMERISRKITTEVGSVASTCKAPRTGAEVKEWGILHTVSKATRIGEAVLEARRVHSNPIDAILQLEGGKTLFVGKVVDVDRVATGGFLRGKAKLSGLGDSRGKSLVLEFQNEWLVALEDGTPIAMSPDLICLLDSDSGDAIGTETVRYGQRVTVIALPSPDLLRTEQGLLNVGPRAFGYDFDYQSVFAS